MLISEFVFHLVNVIHKPPRAIWSRFVRSALTFIAQRGSTNELAAIITAMCSWRSA